MWALRDAEIRRELKALGFAMMSYANGKGEMRPTQEQLALLTPSCAEDGEIVSTRTIQRRRGRLEELGWVERIEKGDGRGRASVYRLSFPSANADIRAAETRTETRTPTPPKTRTGVSHQVRHQVITTAGLENGSVKGGSEEQVHPHATTEPFASVSGFSAASTASPLAEPTASSLAAKEALAELARRGCDFTERQREFIVHCFNHSEQGFYEAVNPAFNGSARNPAAVVMHRLREYAARYMGESSSLRPPQGGQVSEEFERQEALKYLANAYCRRCRPTPEGLERMSLDEILDAIDLIEQEPVPA